MAWALPEWTVLALLREESRHGFAIAALTAADGPLGQVWRIPRPLIYRALSRLEPAGLIEPLAVESGAGPQRTVYALTDSGREAVDEWLRQPSEHVRQLRSDLLMKLALLDRRGLDPRGLLRDQRAVLEPIVAALAADRKRQEDFDAVLLAWRHTNAGAALQFVDDLLAEASGGAGGQCHVDRPARRRSQDGG
ncbi:PadR family transcriptional regulator [Saccharopolyspora spinosa]|uniref:PadR family transcriptional regulator n=1 Tax=Saccharopolyspora spinosa TaxID=60894 RepID=UPI000237B191|nr:PadR family transcriptional regulator [Saccharopolyspora spinosa]